MKDRSRARRGIKTADRVFDVIEILFDRGEMTTSELADELGVAASTAHEYLTTFEAREYVTRLPDGSYALSLKFLDHGERVRQRYRIYQTAKPSLEQLGEETGEVAWLYTEEHGYAVPLDTAKGRQAVQVVGRIGNRKPMHHISAGKAMLARMSNERVRDIIDRHGLPEATVNTITDEETLFEELDTIRDRGYALNDSEEVDGIRAVGMAIETSGGIHGAFSVSGPKNRMSDDRFRGQLPEILSGAVNEVELKLTYA